MAEKRYPKGLYFNDPRENAPDFVKGAIAIKKDQLMEWLNEEQPNDKGYIYLDVLKGTNKETGEPKPYVTVNDYQKERINYTKPEENQIKFD